MRPTPDMRTVPLISSRDAYSVFAAWANRHRVLTSNGEPARLRRRCASLDTVYFASTEETEVVKIGWSGDPIRRVTALRSPKGAAMVLRVVLADLGFADEGFLHDVLARFSVATSRKGHNYEFYRGDTPVADLMSRLARAAKGRMHTLYRVPVVRVRRGVDGSRAA